MAEYGPAQGCARNGDLRTMVVDDEIVQDEENDSSKDDQLEIEPN